MKKSNWKAKAITLGAILLVCSYYLTPRSESHYEIINEKGGAYASYSEGLIYIGDEDFLEELDCVQEGDVLVEDERLKPDNPNMKVYQSCDIHSVQEMNEILSVLCEYEEEYPTDWERSISSMKLEWVCHNLSYDFCIRRDRSTDVDFDNREEELYDHKILNKILKL